jgi:hypothetical protein
MLPSLERGGKWVVRLPWEEAPVPEPGTARAGRPRGSGEAARPPARSPGALGLGSPAVPALTQHPASLPRRGGARLLSPRLRPPRGLGPSARARPRPAYQQVSAAPPPAGSRGLPAPRATSGFAIPGRGHVTDGRRAARVRTPACPSGLRCGNGRKTPGEGRWLRMRLGRSTCAGKEAFRCRVSEAQRSDSGQLGWANTRMTPGRQCSTPERAITGHWAARLSSHSIQKWNSCVD